MKTLYPIAIITAIIISILVLIVIDQTLISNYIKYSPSGSSSGSIPIQPEIKDRCFEIGLDTFDVSLWKNFHSDCKLFLCNCLAGSKEFSSLLTFQKCLDTTQLCEKKYSSKIDVLNEKIILGDIDVDKKITQNDFSLFNACLSCNYYSSSHPTPCPSHCALADINADGSISDADSQILSSCSSSFSYATCARERYYDLFLRTCLTSSARIDPITCYRKLAMQLPYKKEDICSRINTNICSKYSNWPTCPEQADGIREDCKNFMPFIDDLI